MALLYSGTSLVSVFLFLGVPSVSPLLLENYNWPVQAFNPGPLLFMSITWCVHLMGTNIHRCLSGCGWNKDILHVLVSWVWYVRNLLCCQPDVSTTQCVLGVMCPHPCVSCVLYVHNLMCPVLCVHNLICPGCDVSTFWCVLGVMCPQPNVS